MKAIESILENIDQRRQELRQNAEDLGRIIAANPLSTNSAGLAAQYREAVYRDDELSRVLGMVKFWEQQGEKTEAAREAVIEKLHEDGKWYELKMLCLADFKDSLAKELAAGGLVTTIEGTFRLSDWRERLGRQGSPEQPGACIHIHREPKEGKIVTTVQVEGKAPCDHLLGHYRAGNQLIHVHQGQMAELEAIGCMEGNVEWFGFCPRCGEKIER